MGAVVCRQLEENTPHVRFHGVFTYEEVLRNDFVGISVGNFLQNLYFPAGQRRIGTVFGEVGCDPGGTSLQPPCTRRIASRRSFLPASFSRYPQAPA